MDIGLSLNLGINISLSLNLGINICLSWDLDINIWLSGNLLMNISLSFNLGINISFSSDLGMDIRLSLNLGINVGLSKRVKVSISYGRIIMSSIYSSNRGMSIGNWLSSICHGSSSISVMCNRSGSSISIGIRISISETGWDDGSSGGSHTGKDGNLKNTLLILTFYISHKVFWHLYLMMMSSIKILTKEFILSS